MPTRQYRGTASTVAGVRRLKVLPPPCDYTGVKRSFKYGRPARMPMEVPHGGRRQAAFRRRQSDIHVRYQPTAADTEAHALNAIALKRAREIIEAMPLRRRQIALMRWQDHRKASEIAEELGVAEGTVHAHIHAARATLKAGLAQYYPFAKDDKARKDDNDNGRGAAS
jgi:DNA-binding CsgD family transcriptional regulator